MYFIEEVPSETMHDRRRSYRLTKKGWDRLAEEFLYYQHIAQQGRKRQI
jgi:DNA-binding PadR family transcriptional regulator